MTASSESARSDGAPRTEPWVRIAWAVLLLAVGWALYLGSRPAGRGPIDAPRNRGSS